LSACEQELKYFWGIGKPTSYPFYTYRWWRSHEWANSAELYQAVYDDWDRVTQLYFTVVDCINVLSMILIIKESSVPRGVQGFNDYQRPRRTLQSTRSVPASVPFVPMVEVYPLPREPYFVTATPLPPADAPPPAETIAWDSGPPAETWDDTSDDWAAQMKEAVRVALAKLEFVRRWVGKIRKQMPWYKSIPIERIPPAQDPAQNPFGDVSPPNLPWQNGN
jgi:hypothetical protein